MITATEAVRLPSAQLTDDEQRAVASLLAQIDAAVREKMRRPGIELKIETTNTNVIAEVSLELKRMGWNPQWQGLAEQSRIKGAQPRQIGFLLALVPSEAAYAVLM